MAEKDLEIAAMGRIAKLLGELSEAERGRVVKWVAEKFGPQAATLPLNSLATSGAAVGEGWRNETPVKR